MTAPLRSFNTDFGRFYSHPSSGVEDAEGRYRPNPSITNILKNLDSDFLPGFKAKQVAEAAVTRHDEIGRIAEKFGSQTAIGVLKAIPNQPHPAAAIGDEVHLAIEHMIKGEKPAPLTTITAVRMFAQFVNFMKVHEPEVVRSEFTVWNYDIGYAGTGDLLFYLGGKLWAVDVKTGARVYPKVAAQVAAIMHGDELIREDGAIEPNLIRPDDDKAGVLHIRPMSAKLYELDRMAEAWDAFKACKVLFDWGRFQKENHVPGNPSFMSKADLKNP